MKELLILEGESAFSKPFIKYDTLYQQYLELTEPAYTINNTLYPTSKYQTFAKNDKKRQRALSKLIRKYRIVFKPVFLPLLGGDFDGDILNIGSMLPIGGISQDEFSVVFKPLTFSSAIEEHKSLISILEAKALVALRAPKEFLFSKKE